MKPLISILLLCAVSAHAWKLSLKPETIAKLQLVICKFRYFCLPIKWRVCAHDDQLGNKIFYNSCFMRQHNACYNTNYFVLDMYENKFWENTEICEKWTYKFRKRENPREGILDRVEKYIRPEWPVCAHDQLKGNKVFRNVLRMRRYNRMHNTKFFVLDLGEADLVKNPDICYRWKHKFRYEEEPRTPPSDNSLLGKLLRFGNEKETTSFERFKQLAYPQLYLW